VKDLYDRLNRGANVAFDQMEPGTDSMKLHATSFGTRMSAAANLSECQLNCLGLAMWLMRATTPSSPFGFVLLDDPVQSMDDDHTEAFITDIVPLLLDQHGKQVIVLSHVARGRVHRDQAANGVSGFRPDRVLRPLASGWVRHQRRAGRCRYLEDQGSDAARLGRDAGTLHQDRRAVHRQRCGSLTVRGGIRT
jgi:hypothetical protein